MMKTDIWRQLTEAAAFLEEAGFHEIDEAVILGTGLGKLVDKIAILKEIPFARIPHFAKATVESHHGRLLLADAAGKRVLICQGRFHAYEGYQMHQVVLPVRVAKILGSKKLLLSNASGALNPSFRKGDLVVLADHINLQPFNPLTGANVDELGPRFPDMSMPYDNALRAELHASAGRCSQTLKEGVYVAVAGPNLETRAEYRFLRAIGAVMVGMSTVPEVIAAVHMGLPCVAVSVITDECNPDSLQPTSITEIIAAARQADDLLSDIFLEYLCSPAKALITK